MGDLNDYTVWFDPSDWSRVRARLAPFNWSDADDGHLPVRMPWWMNQPSGSMALPPEGALSLTTAAISDQTMFGASELVGMPVNDGLPRHSSWSDELFCRYVLGKEFARAKNLSGVPQANWATLAAFIKTPVYLEFYLEFPMRDAELAVYAISPDGRIAQGHMPLPKAEEATELAECRLRIREDLFASRLATESDGGICLAHYGLGPCRDETRAPTAEDIAPAQAAFVDSCRFAMGRMRDSRFPGAGAVARRRASEFAMGRTRDSRFPTDWLEDVLCPAQDEVSDYHVAEVVARGRDGSFAIYSLRLCEVHPHGGALYRFECFREGVRLMPRDHTTGSAESEVASPDQWAVWILKDGALRAAVSEGASHLRWQGSDVDAMLNRAESSVVEYDERETLGFSMKSTAELQAWVDGALASSPTRLTAWRFDADDHRVHQERVTLIERHAYQRATDAAVTQQGVEGLARQYQARGLDPWIGVREWFHFGETGRELPPSLSLHQVGEDIERYTAESCVDIELIRDYLSRGEVTTSGGWWWVLELEGTPTALAFPSAESMISIATDNDGATVEVVVRWPWARIAEKVDDQAFRCRWSDWYDESRPVTEADIAERAAYVEDSLSVAGDTQAEESS
jgi:hypothetical protein